MPTFYVLPGGLPAWLELAWLGSDLLG